MRRTQVLLAAAALLLLSSCTPSEAGRCAHAELDVVDQASAAASENYCNSTTNSQFDKRC